MGARSEYRFVCPECAEAMEVNDAMREALLENGCVICSAAVTPAAFTQADDEEA